MICDWDAKWSTPVRERLGEAGIRVVQTPFQAPTRMPTRSALPLDSGRWHRETRANRLGRRYHATRDAGNATAATVSTKCAGVTGLARWT